MMNQGVAIFIIILTVMVIGTAVALELIRTWRVNRRLHAEHGDRRALELLTSENAGLKGQVARLEERLSVLERIATDPARRTAREIEELR